MTLRHHLNVQMINYKFITIYSTNTEGSACLSVSVCRDALLLRHCIRRAPDWHYQRGDFRYEKEKLNNTYYLL